MRGVLSLQEHAHHALEPARPRQSLAVQPETVAQGVGERRRVAEQPLELLDAGNRSHGVAHPPQALVFLCGRTASRTWPKNVSSGGSQPTMTTRPGVRAAM